MGKLFGKSEDQAIKDQIRKNVEKNSKQSLTIAEYYAMLGSCKDTFERIVRIERLNALERRERKLSDAKQKSRIHDAAVGLLAVEEAEIELRSVSQADDLADAQKKLSFVAKQIRKLDPDTTVSKKDISNQMNFDFDDSDETVTFVERAELVDEQFVECLIQGYTMDECLEKKISGKQSANTESIDFSSGNSDYDEKFIDNILRKDAEKRLK